MSETVSRLYKRIQENSCSCRLIETLRLIKSWKTQKNSAAEPIALAVLYVVRTAGEVG